MTIQSEKLNVSEFSPIARAIIVCYLERQLKILKDKAIDLETRQIPDIYQHLRIQLQKAMIQSWLNDFYRFNKSQEKKSS